MQLTKAQQEGLQICLHRIKNKERYTVIAGYAGTGKTTLVKFIIEALKAEYGLNPDTDICYCAYTGKACQVLQRKGNKPTKTLHRLLWEFRPIGPKKFRKFRMEPLPALVIVDECSMIDSNILEELASHDETHFIFLGDPGQLPPVYSSDGKKKQDGYDLLQNPHIFLTEIMRQAKESEIIQLSMNIREGKPIEYFKGTEVQVIPKEELTEGMLLWADQVICGTNATRTELNKKIRELKGLSGKMQEGDKVICLRNKWNAYSNQEEPLVNGMIGTVDNIYESFLVMPNRYTKIPFYCCNFWLDDEEAYESIPLDIKSIEEGEYSLTYKQEKQLRDRYKEDADMTIPMEFTYGYAITCHKSQGSEWDKVLIYEERFPFDREEHKRWLYTAVTRRS